MSAKHQLWHNEMIGLCSLLQGVHGGHGVVLAPSGCEHTGALVECTGMMRLHHLVVDAHGELGGALQAHLTNWPLATESCDLLLLWHVIDNQRFWPMVIEESARILAPGGLLLVVYHGALSPWRLRRHMSARQCVAGMQLQRALREQDLQPLSDRGLSWQPPLGRGRRWQQHRLDRWGPWWPWPAASRVSMARRETPGMTPIHLRDRLRATPAGGQFGLAGNRRAGASHRTHGNGQAAASTDSHKKSA